jgi:predicted transcriptional regulator
MSLRPEFATAILNGAKRWEFRRVRCAFASGDVIYVYATDPVQRVVGRCSVGAVRFGPPSDVLKLELTPSLRERTREYLDGAAIATAIELVDPLPLSPLPISAIWPSMRAPQSYAFVGG